MKKFLHTLQKNTKALFSHHKHDAGFTLFEVMATISLFALMTTVLIASYPDSTSKVELANAVSDVQGVVRDSQLKAGAIETSSDPAGGYGLYFDAASTSSFIQFKDLAIANPDPTQLIGNNTYDGESEIAKVVTIPEGFSLRNICVGNSSARPFDPNLCSRTTPSLGTITVAYSRTSAAPLIYINSDQNTKYASACIEFASQKASLVAQGGVRNMIISQSGFASATIGACDEAPQSLALNTSNGTYNSGVITSGATIFGSPTIAKPTITLNGTSTMYVYRGQLYNEPGVVAHDANDGDLTGKVKTSLSMTRNRFSYSVGNQYSSSTSGHFSGIFSNGIGDVYTADNMKKNIINISQVGWSKERYQVITGGIPLTPKTTVFFSSSGTGRIFAAANNQVYSIDPTTGTYFSVGTTSGGVGVNSAVFCGTYLFCLANVSNKIDVIDVTNGGSGVVAIKLGSFVPFNLVYSSASGVLYATDRGSNSVMKINIATIATSTLISGLNNQPSGIALDSSGNVYVANTSGNSVQKITVLPVPTKNTIISTSTSPSPTLVALDASDDIYVVSTNGLAKYSSSTKALMWSKSLANIKDMVMTSSGVYLITSTGSGSLYKVPLNGSSLTKLTDYSSVPANLAVDTATGDAYTVNGDFSLHKTTSGGTLTTVTSSFANPYFATVINGRTPLSGVVGCNNSWCGAINNTQKVWYQQNMIIHGDNASISMYLSNLSMNGNSIKKMVNPTMTGNSYYLLDSTTSPIYKSQNLTKLSFPVDFSDIASYQKYIYAVENNSPTYAIHQIDSTTDTEVDALNSNGFAGFYPRLIESDTAGSLYYLTDDNKVYQTTIAPTFSASQSRFVGTFPVNTGESILEIQVTKDGHILAMYDKGVSGGKMMWMTPSGLVSTVDSSILKTTNSYTKGLSFTLSTLSNIGTVFYTADLFIKHAIRISTLISNTTPSIVDTSVSTYPDQDTYTITYTVANNAGVVATTTRKVIVLP